MPANANGEEKQLIKKHKPDDASLASEPSAIAEKREDYETLSPVVPPVTEKEERGPIKDRSCTDVLCLGENCIKPKRIMVNIFVNRLARRLSRCVGRYPRINRQILERKNGKSFFLKG